MAPEKADDQLALAQPKKLPPNAWGPHNPPPRSPGRPRKGETLQERLEREDARVARKALRARNNRLMREDQIGNRAWENYLAYRVGLPKQAFVVETQDAPGWTLMQRLAARGVLPAVVEGEARVIADGDAAPASEAEGR